MIRMIKKMFFNALLDIKNNNSGKIKVLSNVVLDIDSTAKIDVSGKLILGDSDWKNDNRNTGIKMSKNSTLIVNGKEKINTGCYVSIGENATLNLGGDGFLNHGCNIDCCEHITIGKGTVIAKQVLIRDSDNHEMLYEGYVQSAPIAIGEHCWIGMRAIILKGVTIGDGAVVAAGAIVTNDVPANTLVAGIPARVVKENVVWK